MRLQKTTLVSLSTLLIPLTVYGESRVVTIWEERPRFFTAAPGEEHSRFMNVVWYERPRFFTRAEGEEHSRFYRIVNDRPRIFKNDRCAKRVSCASPCATTVAYTPCATCSYKSTCATRTRLTSYFDNGCHRCKHARRCGTRCDTVAYRATPCGVYDPCRTTMAEGYYTTTSFPSSSSSYVSVAPAPVIRDVDTIYLDKTNSYGSAVHSNVTHRTAIPGSQFTLTSDTGNRSLDSIIASWPQESRTVALAMQSQYGKPDTTSNDQIVWRDHEPWAEIIVFRNGIPHGYPTPHNDVLAQSIYFDVDADDLETLNNFRANVKADHSRGLLTSKCKDEAMNFLALNLAHDILTGEMSVVEANSVLNEKSRSGNTNDEYMNSLQFDVGTDMADENRDIDTDD